jgi:TRAP-type C4-dicarboxylate transport system substrate-binding protein
MFSIIKYRTGRLLRRSLFIITGCLAGSGFPVDLPAAGPVRVNLGTLAPQGSIYHRALLAMRQEWAQSPEGGVRLVIYPDGTQGGEADMVRLMRIGMLQSGLLTSVGLGYIEPEMAGLQAMPLMFHDLHEFDYVSERLRPRLEKRLLNRGFVVLFWIDAGWVRFFTKTPT